MDQDEEVVDSSRASHSFDPTEEPAFSRGKGDGQESTEYAESGSLISNNNYVGNVGDVPDGFELHVVHIVKGLGDSLGISLIPCGEHLKAHFKVG